jgi:hypothetical protein
MGLTLMEQKLLIAMSKSPIRSDKQKVYKNRTNFYKAIWKLRDMELIENNDITIDGRKAKEWKLRLDGIFLVKILSKVKM